MTKDALKWATLTLLILCCMGMTYFCHFIIRADVVFTHLFYVPIALASFWFCRKGVLVALLLYGCLVASHGLSDLDTEYIHDFLRSVVFVFVALVIAMLREQSLKTEQSLCETRNYLESLIDYANAPIIVWNPKFRIARFNHAFEHLAGYTSDEIVGQKLHMLFPEASRDESLARIERTLGGEYWESVEIPILRKDGDTRVALWNSANIYAEDGATFISTIAQGQDITERKHVETELRESEEKLAGIIDSSTDQIIMIDDQFNVVWANNIAKTMFGYGIVGKKCYGMYGETNTICEPCIVKQCCKDGKVHEFEKEIVKADGRHVHFWCTGSVTAYYEDGRPKMVVEFLRDITERKRAEEALLESEEKYHVLFETAKDAIFLTDETGKFVDVNQAACESLGYSKEELLELSNKEIDADFRGYEAFLKVWDGLLKEVKFEVNQQRKDGTLLPVEITGNLFTGGGQRFSLAIARDITQRKQAEESTKKRAIELEAAYRKLRGTQAKLIQAGKMAAMGTLGAGIAHQLNQPLAGIRGFAQTVLMQIDKNNPFYKDLKIIEEQTGYMRDIVRNVSGFARRSEFKKEPIDINKPVDKALELLNEQLRVHGIKLVKSLAPDLPMVNADFNQMQQVFISFIVNAREALDALPLDARKELTINSGLRDEKSGESWIELKFSDTGPGMHEDIRDRIYEPFFTTKGPSSTGLGLYLNYGMIQDHGGYIELVSEEGKGASFIVKLPPLGSRQ